jgi:hypothetical protein
VTGVLKGLDGVIRGVHYNSDAEGLVVVVDCDNTELHDRAHDMLPQGSARCRFCQIKNAIARARAQLKPREHRPELKVAIGLAVPAIEAWYLVGTTHRVGEALWLASVEGRIPRARLKQLIYGTDRPSLEYETKCAVENVRRIIADVRAIEVAFPIGFGLMAEEIRSWSKARGEPAGEPPKAET